MRITYRIPSKDPYGYVEITEDNVSSSPEAVVDVLEGLMEYHKEEKGEGLTKKEFDDFLDHYLQTNTGSTDTYSRMNRDQQQIIQAIKRSLKRIEYKNGDTENSEVG